MSIDRWMDKEDVVHIINGMLLSLKKEWNNVICNSVDEPRYWCTKWKIGKDKYDITFMWNLKKTIQINLFTKQKQTHRHKNQTYGSQRGERGQG